MRVGSGVDGGGGGRMAKGRWVLLYQGSRKDRFDDMGQDFDCGNEQKKLHV